MSMKSKSRKRLCSMMVKKTRRNAEGTEFGAEEVISAPLPEELVEKIIARIPYPSIFKARLLSKSWLARFKPISILDTAEEKCLAKNFHKQVTENSISWDTLCLACTTLEDPVVYNRAKKRWQALPPLCFLPNRDHILPPLTKGFDDPHLEGAFLYNIVMLNAERPVREAIFLVNILTGEGRLLPVHPAANRTRIVFIKLVVDPFLESFKVIIFCRVSKGEDDEGQHFAHIYDSKSELSKSKSCFSDYPNVPIDWAYLSCTFHNGVLYIMSSSHWDFLLAFDLDNWNLEGLRLTSTHNLDIDILKLVILDANLVMMGSDYSFEEHIRVFKVDLVSLQLLEVARCPQLEIGVNARMVAPTLKPNGVKARDIMMGTVASEPNCVFFNVNSDSIVKYNKRKNEWRVFSVGTDLGFTSAEQDDSYFRPGLNPFMAV